VVLPGAGGEELKGGVGAEGVVVVLVRIADQDAIDAGADHLQEDVFGESGVAGVVEGLGDGPGQADTLVERADGEQSGVAGEPAWRPLDDKRGRKSRGLVARPTVESSLPPRE
jgi:hypothetical protein